MRKSIWLLVADFTSDNLLASMSGRAEASPKAHETTHGPLLMLGRACVCVRVRASGRSPSVCVEYGMLVMCIPQSALERVVDKILWRDETLLVDAWSSIASQLASSMVSAIPNDACKPPPLVMFQVYIDTKKPVQSLVMNKGETKHHRYPIKWIVNFYRGDTQYIGQSMRQFAQIYGACKRYSATLSIFNGMLSLRSA